MYMMFWDRQGILLIDFLTTGDTVNAEHYCETLQKLQWAIQNKRHGMLSVGVVLLHDNAWPHMARPWTHLLQEFSWEVFRSTHQPHSLELTPSGFHLFLHLKKFLSGQHQRFQKGRDECHTVISIPGADFYDTGIQKLVPWYEKCFNSRDEKCWKIVQPFLYLFQSIFSTKMGFVCVNGSRETYYVNALHRYCRNHAILWK